MDITVKCICGHEDDWEAFATETNGVWICPVCSKKRDSRTNYTTKEFVEFMKERKEMIPN
jgi:hypothetical protein